MFKRSLTLFVLSATCLSLSLAESAGRDDVVASKLRARTKGGFYSSRFGDYYKAGDFVSDPSTVRPEQLRQLPVDVAAPHQQNSDQIKTVHEYPNVEEQARFTAAPPVMSEELNVKGGIKGGIKGGVKGHVKGGIRTSLTFPVTPRAYLGVKGGIKGVKRITEDITPRPERISTIQDVYTTYLPVRSNLGVKGGYTNRFNIPTLAPEVFPTTIRANLGVKGGIKGGIKGGVKGGLPRFSIPAFTTAQPEIFTTYQSPTTANLVKGRKGIKNIKGGRKGYQYGGGNIKNLFPRARFSTESPAPTTAYPELTTVGSYEPEILGLNIPTARIVEEVPTTTVRETRETTMVVPTTEQYREDPMSQNIQQTELPYQQTELPYQQTELPVQQTELPYQQTELPYQQTELPVQQTELPYQQTELPVQQTELPYQQTEYPIQQTIAPEVTTYREVELIIPTTENYVQETQRPQYIAQTTQGPLEETQNTQGPYEDLQITEGYPTTQQTIHPTTTEYLNIQETEIPQLTQKPDEPVYTTTTPRPVKGIKGVKGHPQIKGKNTSDEFSRYPLGAQGRHNAGEVRGKGGKKAEGKSVETREVSVNHLGGSGLHSPRRIVDPSVPRLPSLVEI